MKIVVRDRLFRKNKFYLISKQPLEKLKQKIEYLNNRLNKSDNIKLININELPKSFLRNNKIEEGNVIIEFLGYNDNYLICYSLASFIEDENEKYKLFLVDPVFSDKKIEFKIGYVVEEEFRLYITNYNSDYFKIFDNRIGKENIFKFTKLKLHDDERFFILKDITISLSDLSEPIYNKEYIENYIEEGIKKYKENLLKTYKITRLGKLIYKLNLTLT